MGDHDLLDLLDDAPARACGLGAGGARRRRRRARARPREAAEPELVARSGVRALRLGRRVPRARAERLALLAVRVPPPRDRLDARRRLALPARPGAASRVRSCGAPASRSTFVLLAVLLFADRDAAPIFGRFGSGGAREARARRSRRRCCARSSLPGSRARARHLMSSEPVTQSRVDTPPTEVRLRFNEPVTITSNAIEVLAPDGTVLSGTARTEDDGYVVVAPVSRLVDGQRLHRALARDRRRRALARRASSRSASVSRRRRRPRPSAPRGRRGATTSRAGRSSARSRC